VSRIAYIDQTATVEITFAPDVVPLITRLEEHFTKYEIQQVSHLSSAYAVRMHELLICWRSTGKTPVIELSELRKRMGVLDGEYTRSDNFKRWVLDTPLKQINEHTDITASYEQHKKSRVITGFSFKFKQKKQNNDKTPKKGDSSPHTEKPNPIPTNFVKQPENANMSDLDKRASQIAGLIMS
ncbi:replication initiation protein, partial [Acinetobacter sp. FNA3]|uniref:RepB family plasmid replication initiator protein n=1 Tax=Acinetobacter pollinis TaxID=2605270 RepID=UPI0018C1CF78